VLRQRTARPLLIQCETFEDREIVLKMADDGLVLTTQGLLNASIRIVGANFENEQLELEEG